GAIVAVALIEFHHTLGPNVQQIYPQSITNHLSHAWKNLAFFSLPEGSHQKSAEHVYFHLPVTKEMDLPDQSCLFAVSCIAQIPVSQLAPISVTKEITRSSIQKAIVVVSTNPANSFVKSKVEIALRAYMKQDDLTDTKILEEVYQMLNSKAFSADMFLDGTVLRTIVPLYKSNILLLFKLMLLEKRIVIYSAYSGTLSQVVHSLMSLLPAIDLSITNSVPRHSSATCQLIPPRESKHTQSNGLPLVIFDRDNAVLQPYIPLNEIDYVCTKSLNHFLIGITNTILLKVEFFNYDVFFNVDTGVIDLKDQDDFVLSTNDNHFIEEICLYLSQFPDDLELKMK
ncbi:hypothetical protein ROZALSC1DRAFT_30659, partial [Rozella allomycis CSF55]